MKRIGVFPLILVVTLFSVSVVCAQERLPIDFENGDFEKSQTVTSWDGSQTANYPAGFQVYNGFINAAYGGIDTVLELDTTEVRPGSTGKQSVHVMHPPSRFTSSYQTHLSQVALFDTDLYGLTFDAEIWIKTQDWWGNSSHYVHVWLMPVDQEGIEFDAMQSLSYYAYFLGPKSSEWETLKEESVQTRLNENKLFETNDWTLCRLENIPVEEPDTYGYRVQISCWYTNSDNGQRTTDEGEITGECHAWFDDLKLVIPSGSDQVGVSDWMLYAE